MTEVTTLQEGIIPSFIWKFVKGLMKNPIHAGILALIVWSYVKNKNRKKESISEDISIPINVGDIVLGGKFKNKKIAVKDIGKNSRGEPTINGKNLMNYRLTPKKEFFSQLNVIREDNTMSNSGALLTKKIPKKEIQKPAKEKDVDPKELVMGIKIEMEHTDDKEEAKKIALQHLAENPKYYSKLKKHVEPKEFFDQLNSFSEINGWKDIGGNPTKNKVKRWQKGDNTAYITKKEWEKKTDYAFGVNRDVFKASWSDDLQEVIKIANNYMRKH